MDDVLITEERIEPVAQRFKVLSEPVRLRLLDALYRHGEMAVSELVEVTGHRQANVSKHLGLLAEHRLVARRKEGLYVYYRLNDRTLAALCLLVETQLREDTRGSHKPQDE